jgi:pyruvate/2-oxoglutarate dehydrogenase complex dihydrolipoamide dehydrogenase (E3) component
VAAAHGARVAVAEEYRVGGTCVIRGCVPTKMLVSGAHFAELMKFDESAALAYLENDILLTAKVAERLGINIGSATGFAATASAGTNTDEDY